MVATKPVDFAGSGGTGNAGSRNHDGRSVLGGGLCVPGQRADRIKLVFWDGTGLCCSQSGWKHRPPRERIAVMVSRTSVASPSAPCGSQQAWLPHHADAPVGPITRRFQCRSTAIKIFCVRTRPTGRHVVDLDLDRSGTGLGLARGVSVADRRRSAATTAGTNCSPSAAESRIDVASQTTAAVTIHGVEQRHRPSLRSSRSHRHIRALSSSRHVRRRPAPVTLQAATGSVIAICSVSILN